MTKLSDDERTLLNSAAALNFPALRAVRAAYLNELTRCGTCPKAPLQVLSGLMTAVRALRGNLEFRKMVHDLYGEHNPDIRGLHI